jgi:hypothetical protein
VQVISNLANRLSMFGVIKVWEREERYSHKWGNLYLVRQFFDLPPTLVLLSLC